MQKNKHLLILFLLLFFNFNGYSQKKMETNLLEKYYPFNGYYIDLENLKELEVDILPASDFKKVSIYSFRFYAPRNWIDNFYKSVTYKNNIFSIKKDNSIEIFDNVLKKHITFINQNNSFSFDNTVGNHFLFATKTGVVEVKKINNPNNYIIIKYDEKGNKIFETEFEHTYIKIEGNVHTSNPYLTYLTCTNDYIIFNSYNRTIPKTISVNLLTGEKIVYRTNFVAVIRTDNEDNIHGFIEIKDNGFKCTIINNIWRDNIKNFYSNSAETLVKDSILVISFYHKISTGSSLFAYNWHTGKLLWQADVKQLNISHSEYYNIIYLSLYKNKIIMEGIEAEGKYVQIFDLLTGKRLFSTF